MLCDQFTNSNLKISSELSQYTSFIVNDNIAGVQFHPEKVKPLALISYGYCSNMRIGSTIILQKGSHINRMNGV